MAAYILAFKGGDVPHATLHPCCFSNDLSKQEMEILQQVMERNWGFDEEHSQEGDDWFEFQVVGATEDTVGFVELRQQWAAHRDGKPVGNWNDTIQRLHQAAEEYAAQIRATRAEIPRGIYLTVDYGRGEEVFNYVDCLTDQEIETLSRFLGRQIYEEGGQFDWTYTEDLAVDDPSLYIKFKWDWESLREGIKLDDEAVPDSLATMYWLSKKVIDEIRGLRETTAVSVLPSVPFVNGQDNELAAIESESSAGSNTERGADNGIVRADTGAKSVVREDSNADSDQNSSPRLPDTPDVRDLCRLLQKELPKGRSHLEIAREFTGEMPDKDKKAKSLLRQARRYRHLWDDPAN